MPSNTSQDAVQDKETRGRIRKKSKFGSQKLYASTYKTYPTITIYSSNHRKSTPLIPIYKLYYCQPSTATAATTTHKLALPFCTWLLYIVVKNCVVVIARENRFGWLSECENKWKSSNRGEVSNPAEETNLSKHGIPSIKEVYWSARAGHVGWEVFL